MRFNALVVAAMVITSVNAHWREIFMSCLRGSCGSDEFHEYKPIENDPKCDRIMDELRTSQGKISDLNIVFWTQMPELYIIMERERNKGMNERHDTGKKGKEDDSNLEEIQKYIQSNPDAIPRLKEIKKSLLV
ncbi:hypothetical protein BASA60_003829 [Batrachochytrium salamandrivorans]|nr:hypothetical protein BASA60_003829 [Batrachochytrium salamandrivorans]